MRCMPAVAQPTEAATRIAVFMMAGSRVVTEMDMDRGVGGGCDEAEMGMCWVEKRRCWGSSPGKVSSSLVEGWGAATR
jgi:hypothetical protein